MRVSTNSRAEPKNLPPCSRWLWSWWRARRWRTASRKARCLIEDALPIMKQITEALEYAHERGIVHRDLKPANIKIKPDGTVKVLDFGLAKALSDESNPTDISNSPTLTAAATKAGLILGTAAYMSPEQARGKAVDRRADIWSFGAVGVRDAYRQNGVQRRYRLGHSGRGHSR